MEALCLKAGLMTSPITVADVRTIPPLVISAGNVISAEKPRRTSPRGFSIRYPLRSLWRENQNRFDAIALDDAVSVDETEHTKLGLVDSQNGNWVSKILRLRKEDREKIENDDDEGQRSDCCSAEEECVDCNDQDDDDEKIEFDKSSFSKLLRRVTLAEASVYAKMSVLGNLAYSIPQIKPGDLKYHGYRFVTSSLEKKEQALKAEKEKLSAEVRQKENGSSEVPKKTEVLTEVQETEGNPKDKVQANEEKSDENQSSVFAAYRVALSAASYLHSRTTSLLPFKSSKNELSEDLTGGRGTIGDVTSVVAAKEEVKQAVADDLNSSRSSPCDWFICDDDRTATRFFVIQGSESMSSWKANLLFEPIQFEGLDVLVHRGIYEAAKGIFEQMLPEVRDHVRNHGDRALFRFTGHSLGGSLSLLVNLMLLIRGEVQLSSLLPVITFGAPQIMCGGDRLLHKLRLPRSHVQSIAMHRDIVPRAFSCNYPSHIGDIFKALNRNFRNHPCLKSEGKLYPPMGEFLILQPGEKFSPRHDLLPAGSGLYILSCPVSDAGEAEKQIQAALSAFLNSPHPLEIVSDRSSYGSQGTIIRDHDMTSYLKSVRNVFRQELRRVMKARREHRRRVWWAHVQFNFAGVLQTGTASLKRLRGLVGSRHMQLLVVLFLPVHMLILGAYSIISSHIGKFL